MSIRESMSGVVLPSNRKFGFFFAVVFAAIALYTGYSGGISGVSIAAAVVSVILILLALLAPSLLSTPNKYWAYIGLLLGLIVSPIVLGIIFFGMFTPIAAVLRLKGRDELRLKAQTVDSVWITRTPSGPAPKSFKDQF